MDQEPETTGKDQEEPDSRDGTSENSTQDSGRGLGADGGVAVDVGREKANQDETADEQSFSEWKVHPRVTPRKDVALQVRKNGIVKVN